MGQFPNISTSMFFEILTVFIISTYNVFFLAFGLNVTFYFRFPQILEADQGNYTCVTIDNNGTLKMATAVLKLTRENSY